MLGLKPQQFGRSIKQFFNLADNGVDYGNWDVDSGSSNGSDGINLVQGTDRAELPTELKESTEYTFILEITDSDGTSGLGLQLDGEGVDQAFGIDINFGFSAGVFAVTATTKATITNNRVYFIISGLLTGQFVKFKLLAIIEGDATSENITEEQPYGNFDVIYTP